MAPAVLPHPEAVTQGGTSLSIDSVDPRTRAGDPFVHAGEERRQLRRERRTEQELIEAIREDEARLGRSMTPGERLGFAKGFFGVEYVAEVRLLAAEGLLDGEDEGE
jgi:hypothetical protein